MKINDTYGSRFCSMCFCEGQGYVECEACEQKDVGDVNIQDMKNVHFVILMEVKTIICYNWSYNPPIDV